MATTFNGTVSGTAPGNGSNLNWVLSNANLTVQVSPSGNASAVTATTAMPSFPVYGEFLLNLIGAGAAMRETMDWMSVNTPEYFK